MSDRHAVFILGPHRSGTSCVAGSLRAIGLFLGHDNALGDPQPDNPKGFFEHMALMSINDEILLRLGGNWRTAPTFPPGWQFLQVLSEVRKNAAGIVAGDFSGSRIWGFKDPRSCMTLLFWRAVMTIPIRCIIVIRNPMEVALSLLARNEIPLDEGLAFWLSHTYQAISTSRGLSRRIVFYDRLIEDPRGQLAELAAFAGLESSPEDLEKGAAFVERSLRHHEVSEHDDRSMPEHVKRAWSAVRRFSHIFRKDVADRQDEDVLLSEFSCS